MRYINLRFSYLLLLTYLRLDYKILRYDEFLLFQTMTMGKQQLKARRFTSESANLPDSRFQT